MVAGFSVIRRTPIVGETLFFFDFTRRQMASVTVVCNKGTAVSEVRFIDNSVKPVHVALLYVEA